MGAYSLLLPKRKCRECGQDAKEEVFNRFNSPVGFFCKKHAEEMVERLDEADANINRRIRQHQEELRAEEEDEGT